MGGGREVGCRPSAASYLPCTRHARARTFQNPSVTSSSTSAGASVRGLRSAGWGSSWRSGTHVPTLASRILLLHWLHTTTNWLRPPSSTSSSAAAASSARVRSVVGAAMSVVRRARRARAGGGHGGVCGDGSHWALDRDRPERGHAARAGHTGSGQGQSAGMQRGPGMRARACGEGWALGRRACPARSLTQHRVLSTDAAVYASSACELCIQALPPPPPPPPYPSLSANRPSSFLPRSRH